MSRGAVFCIETEVDPVSSILNKRIENVCAMRKEEESAWKIHAHICTSSGLPGVHKMRPQSSDLEESCRRTRHRLI